MRFQLTFTDGGTEVLDGYGTHIHDGVLYVRTTDRNYGPDEQKAFVLANIRSWSAV